MKDDNNYSECVHDEFFFQLAISNLILYICFLQNRSFLFSKAEELKGDCLPEYHVSRGRRGPPP